MTVPIAPRVIARHVCFAQTHLFLFLFFWVSTFIPSCPLFVFWVSGRQDRVQSAVRTSCCFALQIKSGKQTLHTHHICTSCPPIHTQVDTGAHARMRRDASAAQWSVHGKVILPCEPVALGEFVCSAAAQVKKCVHLSIYNTGSL